jgi:alkyl hydroperoxide reductase subunit AhpF
MLRQRFSEQLQEPVKLKLFTQRASQLTIPGRECQFCGETQQLLEELASLTDKLAVEVVDIYSQPQQAQEYGVRRIPCIVLGDGPNARYYGLPSGYEFVTLIEGIAALSRQTNPLRPETLQQLERITEDLHIQVFVTPT